MSLAKVANKFNTLRSLKDDRKFVLENIDRTDMEFIEFVQQEENRIETKALNEGQKVYHELQQNQPHYLSDARGKKRASVKNFHIADAQKVVSVALEAKKFSELISPGTAKRVIIANHSEFKGVSEFPGLMQQMNSTAARCMRRNPSNLRFIRAVVACAKSALEKKINTVFVASDHCSWPEV